MLLIFSLFACHFAEGEVRSGFSSTSWSSTLSYTTDTGSTTTATTSPAPTGDTGVTFVETGTSPTTSVEMVAFRYWAFEEDRQCWAVRDVERPVEAWGDYVANSCEAREARVVIKYIADLGHCGAFSGRFVGECAVSDPYWLQDCSVGGCCDYSWFDLPGCVIDPYYQTDTGL